MPPKKKTTTTTARVAASAPIRVSAGAGPTVGLELWRFPPAGPFVLYDRTTDRRYTTDTTTWNTAAGLNAADTQRLKDAADSLRDC